MLKSLILYKRLYPFISPYLLKIFFACICAIPLSLCAAGTASLVKPTLDDVFLNKDLRMLTLIPVAIVLLYTTKGVLEYEYNYLLNSTGLRIVTDIRNSIYEHLQTLSISYFQANPTGKLISKVTLDVQLIESAINKSLIAILKESMTIAGLLFIMITKNYKLSLIAILILPWALIPILLFGKKSRKFSTRHQEKRSQLSTLLHETISGNRIVKAFGMEEYEKKRFSDENLKLLKIILRKLKTNLYYPKIDVDTEDEKAIVTIEGFIDKIRQNKIERTKEVKIVFKNTCCERDLKISSKTWEYKIQLRRNDEFEPILFERIEKSVKKEILKLQRTLPEAVAFWAKENKDGVDLFFGFKQVGEIIIKHLKDKFKVKMVRSASLVGLDKKTGKKKFKQTFCIRV